MTSGFVSYLTEYSSEPEASSKRTRLYVFLKCNTYFTLIVIELLEMMMMMMMMMM